MDLSAHIRDIPDFPKPGIVFKDITPLLANHEAMRWAIAEMARQFADQGITKVIGIESRGFLFGPGIALHLDAGFVPMRKPGKLPYKTRSRQYDLEYGKDTLEVHEDAITSDDRVLLVDDLLATGGTMQAAVELAHEMGADVHAASFVVELSFLEGAKRLPCTSTSLLSY